MKKSAGDKAATGRTPRKARPNDVGCSSGPLRLSLRAGFLEKREKGRHRQLFGQMLKDKPVFCLPVQVARPPAAAERPITLPQTDATSKTTRPRQEETCQGPVGRSESCYELASESFTSWSACCLAFLVSVLTLALGSSAWIAFPRLIGFDVAVEVPVGEMPSILSFSAVNPPGISRFLATWAAATH